MKKKNCEIGKERVEKEKRENSIILGKAGDFYTEKTELGAKSSLENLDGAYVEVR